MFKKWYNKDMPKTSYTRVINHNRRRIQEASAEKGVAYEYVSTMKELGEKSGLAIKTACAALLTLRGFHGM